MKKAECAENKSSKSANGKVSAWYYVDFAVSFLACFFSFFPSAFFRVYFIIFATQLVCFVAVSILIYGYKKNPETKPGRVLMRTVRVMVYTAALAGLFVFHKPSGPVFYPVDKFVFCANYDDPDKMFFFLPDKIPSDARDYHSMFEPGWLDGAYIQIEFFTDTEQLNEYRNFAQSCGAVKTDSKECSEYRYASERTGSGENVEIWEFPRPEGGCRAKYCICPENGFFMITC